MEDFKVAGKWQKSKRINGVKHKTVCGRLWENMRTRCTQKFQRQHLNYLGCYVSEEFQDFQYFADWCHEQTGFGADGYQLDKDLLVYGNKCYGPDTCVFIPKSLNNFIKVMPDTNPIAKGVSYRPYDNKSKPYSARIITDGKEFGLGYFETEAHAMQAFMHTKEQVRADWLLRLVSMPVDQRVAERLAVVPLY